MRKSNERKKRRLMYRVNEKIKMNSSLDIKTVYKLLRRIYKKEIGANWKFHLSFSFKFFYLLWDILTNLSAPFILTYFFYRITFLFLSSFRAFTLFIWFIWGIFVSKKYVLSVSIPYIVIFRSESHPFFSSFSLLLQLAVFFLAYLRLREE